jgi:hypothetical protein
MPEIVWQPPVSRPDCWRDIKRSAERIPHSSTVGFKGAGEVRTITRHDLPLIAWVSEPWTLLP